MTLQLVAQRIVDPNDDPKFIYTRPPITFADLEQIFQPVDILARLPVAEHRDLFYTLAHHRGIDGSRYPVRLKTTFEYQTHLAFDCDNVDITRHEEYAEEVAGVLKCPREAVSRICSGFGIHFLVRLLDPITNVDYFHENRLAYKEVCRLVLDRFKAKSLPGKFDTQIFEPSRVFRLPQTTNTKKNRPDSACYVLHHSITQVKLDLPVASGYDRYDRENVSPAEIRRNYPTPDFKTMASECLFTKWALEHPEEVHEPDAFDLFSLLSVQAEDQTLMLDGQPRNAQAVAAWVYEHAVNSQSMARQEFDVKWEQASRYGARKCSTIGARWDKGCEGCPHKNLIPTPLALKSKEHIGSEANGFWVMSGKGALVRPHYEDLAKVFKREQPYVAADGERLLAFNGKFYQPYSELSAKAWLERRVVPTEPLMKAHRNEFLEKLKVMGALTEEQEDRLFERSILGRINCQNGILDIVKGELLPHDPSYGFKYALPYAYQAGEASEFFLDWLATMTQDRVELMESILDIMAYTLWPNYDEHCFVYFVGDGSNGKSTLLEVMRAMVGGTNCSSVSVEQLTRNRFAPASLEGKLVNLCEEASGMELDHSALNVLRNLSSGGSMQVEQKNEKAYTFTNRAKLIFSANRIPKFMDQGHSIRRRLITIPFEHKIEKTDPNVGKRLITEVPQIMSMLVRRIQENVETNHGIFKVDRGGSAAGEAARRFLAIGNSVLEWAQEQLESSADIPPDVFLPVNDAWGYYVKWCEDSGFKFPVNKIAFGRVMWEGVVTKAVGDRERLRRTSGNTQRGFPRTRLKQSALEMEL